ncbi:MAG TPA: metal-sensitive transcriptional regulator [Anaerolineae bacterium]|nr:metal-sensitive transcriptional regulator [Anaerolineae bacterium]
MATTPGSSRRRAASEPRPYGGSREQVLRRLARMEGQVRGVARMIERDEDCMDVLQQTAALRAAVDSVSMLLMEDHVHGCVTSALRSSEADALANEVMDVVRRGMGRPVRSSRAGGEP